MTDYVLGFLFENNGSSVVLIQKNRPEWQAGLLNGVGGKIAAGETEIQAMVREFHEEAGVNTSSLKWHKFATMKGDAFSVACFACWDSPAFTHAYPRTDETICHVSVVNLKHRACVSNLHWLIAMALDRDDDRSFLATIDYSAK